MSEIMNQRIGLEKAKLGYKKVGIAYLLWFFLGSLGIHRFYIKSYIMGSVYLILFIISILTFFFGLGEIIAIVIFIIWIYDAITLNSKVAKVNLKHLNTCLDKSVDNQLDKEIFKDKS